MKTTIKITPYEYKPAKKTKTAQIKKYMALVVNEKVERERKCINTN